MSNSSSQILIPRISPLGIAVANSLAALRAGADRVHVTVNGLGERAGNTNLATLVVAAGDLYGITCAVNEQALGMLSDLVAEISGVELGGESVARNRGRYRARRRDAAGSRNARNNRRIGWAKFTL